MGHDPKEACRTPGDLAAGTSGALQTEEGDEDLSESARREVLHRATQAKYYRGDPLYLGTAGLKYWAAGSVWQPVPSASQKAAASQKFDRKSWKSWELSRQAAGNPGGMRGGVCSSISLDKARTIGSGNDGHKDSRVSGRFPSGARHTLQDRVAGHVIDIPLPVQASRKSPRKCFRSLLGRSRQVVPTQNVADFALRTGTQTRRDPAALVLLGRAVETVSPI